MTAMHVILSGKALLDLKISVIAIMCSKNEKKNKKKILIFFLFYFFIFFIFFVFFLFFFCVFFFIFLFSTEPQLLIIIFKHYINYHANPLTAITYNYY